MHHVLRLLLMPARARHLRTALLSALAITTTVLGLGGASRLASVDYVVQVDFQPAGAVTAASHLPDSGEAFGRHGPEGLAYGWVDRAGFPLALGPDTGRTAHTSADQRLDSAVTTAGAPWAAWELGLPDGRYRVVVGVGAAVTPALVVEGTPIRAATDRRASLTVAVADGRLTVGTVDGSPFTLSFIEVDMERPRPTVTGMSPGPGSTGVPRDTSLTLALELPDGLDIRALGPRSVSLVRERDGAALPARVSAAGDQLRVTPLGLLDADTTYRLTVTRRLRDQRGIAAAPFSSIFTTGRAGGPQPGPDGLGFDSQRNITPAPPGTLFTGVAIGPDHRLYVSTLGGLILRQPIASDGAPGAPETIDTLVETSGKRAIIGMAFDPAATPENPVLWVSHNDPQYISDSPDWSGRVSRLSGARLEYIQDYVVNLPHSYKDHMTNSLSFGPDGALYVLVGSNSAMGSPDKTWGWRPERLMGAALLRLDVLAVAHPPLDAKTEEGGRYDPYAPGAPLTIYATGLRNAYDMVWHSNGELYVPTNGSASGGTTPSSPADPASSPACARRGYGGPPGVEVQQVENQNDWLFRIEPGGFYGHPNPQRCEWVAHGGNPTAGKDLAQIDGYPVGTQPDPNWRGPAFDFGPNRSANGAVEYGGAAFDGRLRGALLVAQYTTDDIIALWPGGPRNDIVRTVTNIPGLTRLSKPLDLIEDPATGNLYVAEFGPPSMISLLRPLETTAARQ